MLDPQNDVYDKRLARHLVSLYYKDINSEEEEHMTMGLLRLVAYHSFFFRYFFLFSHNRLTFF